MKLDKTFYLPKHINIIKSEEDLCDFLRSLFPDFTPVVFQGSIFRSLTTLLFYITGPISFSTLELFMGTFLSQNSSRAKISRYVKNGFFLSYPLKSIDLNSKTLYGISQNENRIMRSYMPELTSDAYIRKKGQYPMHAFGVGLSTLNLMQLKIPFKYYDQDKWESIYYKCSVITDRTMYFDDTNRWYLYLEQDMGTERTSRLLDKIESYGKCTDTNPVAHLVFSSHAVLPSEKPVFNFDISHLEYIRDAMENYNSDSLEDFYEHFGTRLPIAVLVTLKRFLVMNSVYKVASGSYTQIDKFTPLSPLSRSYSLDCLKKLIKTVREYPIISYIHQQYHIAKRKFKPLCQKLTYYFLRTNCDTRFSYIANGCSVYMIPSVMLNNYYEYFNPVDSGLCEKIKKIIRGYFGSSLTPKYATVSKSYYFSSNISSIKLRNCFCTSPDHYFCVEHIGADVAGFVRATCFVKADKSISDHINLLCLCDSEEDILYFCKMVCGKDDSLLKRIVFAYTSELDLPGPMRFAQLVDDEWKVTTPVPYKYTV